MLSDKDIEKRMVEALDEGGRHTVDELVKSTGIDEKRIYRALQTLEEEELCAHITLEGTPRFYITAAHIKEDPPPKKVRKVPDKVPCRKCGELRSPAGMWKHVKYCQGKAKSIEEMVDAVDKVIDRETGAISTAHITITPPADYTITGPQMPTPIDNLPIVAVEDKRSDGERLQDLGELIGEKHWDNFLGAEKRHEYINGFQHGFKHGYEHRIKEEEDGRNKA
jgi:DNA-binding Lrp family transcriptional regulator